MNDNEADATATFHPPHLTEWLDEELEARGWSMGLLVTMLMVHRFPEEWGKIKLELDLWFTVGPTTKKILFTEKFAAELASVFGVSPDLFLNLHKAWMERGQVTTGGNHD